jgi:hypothetical protein
MWRIALFMLMFAGLTVLLVGTKVSRESRRGERLKAHARRLAEQAKHEAKAAEQQQRSVLRESVRDARKEFDRVRARPHNAPPRTRTEKTTKRSGSSRERIIADAIVDDDADHGDQSVVPDERSAERVPGPSANRDWDDMIAVAVDTELDKWVGGFRSYWRFEPMALSAGGVFMFLLIGGMFLKSGRPGAPAWPRRVVAVVLFSVVCAVLVSFL